MRYGYTVYAEWRSSEDYARYKAYGIACLQESRNGAREVTRIGDISCDGRFVQCLAALCTRLQLRPVHLEDVVINAIS